MSTDRLLPVFWLLSALTAGFFADAAAQAPAVPTPPPLYFNLHYPEVDIIWSNQNFHERDPYYDYLKENDLDPNGLYRAFDLEGYRLYRKFEDSNDPNPKLIWQGSFRDKNLPPMDTLNGYFGYTDKMTDLPPGYQLHDGTKVWYALVPFDLNYDPYTARPFSLPDTSCDKIWHLTVIYRTREAELFFSAGQSIESSPAIGLDGTVYVGTGQLLYALASDGKVKWQYQTEGFVKSSPAVDSSGNVYVGAVDSYLYALNSVGILRWRYKTGSMIVSSPAIGVDGTIYVGSCDYGLHAVNPDGTLRWKYHTGDAIASAPAVGRDGTVYIGSNDRYFYALNPDGTLKWRFQVASGSMELVFNQPSAAISANGVIYTVLGGKYLYALNPNGSQRWKQPVEKGPSPVIGEDGTVYVGGGYAFNYNGSLKWQPNPDAFPYFSTGQSIISADGCIYMTSVSTHFDPWNNHYGTYVSAVLPDGNLKWECRIPDSYPIFAPPRSVRTSSLAPYPAITDNGAILVCYGEKIYSFDSGTEKGLAESSWPKPLKDYRNTGNALSSGGNSDTGRGDLDGNSKIDVFDLLAFLRQLGTGGQTEKADLNNDAKIDVFDLLELLKLLARK
jgi:outer membrane protein assembly factor BamB